MEGYIEETVMSSYKEKTKLICNSIIKNKQTIITSEPM